MIDLSAYFHSGTPYTSMSFLIVYTLFIWILVITNLVVLLKVLFSKTDNESNKSLLIITLIWLNILLLGEVFLTNIQIFSNRTIYVFNGIDNIFIPFGLSLSILYFSRYLQTQLMINKYSKRMSTISGQIISIAFYVTFLALLLLLGRFILLPFFSIEGLDEVNIIIEIISTILAIFVFILLILALFQLQHERNFISSKLDQARIKFYGYFIISLLVSLIFIILNLIASFIVISESIGQLLAIPVYLGCTTGVITLFFGYTMPEWYRKRTGLSISFGV